ncbi:MAG TPA: hypothetical protein DCY42_11530 [Chloroflexi bacterium]|nr:hypothetical protein [Chloroflexota bacterium]
MFAGMNVVDMVGMLVAFVLTVFVLLYIFDDNALFRLAIYVFIGVAAGYAGAVALKDVILPLLFSLQGQQMLLVVVWMALLAMKLFPQTAKFGNPAAGLLVGVGAAVAVGGAIQGTLLPQITASGEYFAPGLMKEAMTFGQYGTVAGYFLRGLVVLVGTVATLAHFHFGAKPAPNQIPSRKPFIEVISKIGQVFVAVAFGVIFAGIYSAALSALIERLVFIIDVILQMLPGL